MTRRGRRLAQRIDESRAHVVDLDRREPESLEPRCLTGGTDEPRQVESLLTVAIAAEVDAREHDFAMPLRDAAGDLGEHGARAAAARTAPDERDDAEVAREAAAVLDVDERADAIEARVSLHATERADVARDEVRRRLAPARDDRDVVRQADERVSGEIRSAAGDEDATVRARRPSGRLARLAHGLVRDAAGVDDRYVRAAF